MLPGFIRNNKTLLKNFSSLSILQISNYLFPLISLPYLVRVLGPEKFGLVNFAAAFVAYFSVVTDYGFNISATQQVSINREEKEIVSRIFSSVYFTRLLLFLVSAFVFSILLFSFNKFQTESEVFLFSFSIVLGTTLSLSWFFQGMEEMKYITIITIAVKIFWIIAIFVLVKSPSDFLILILLNGGSLILIGVISFIVIIFSFDIRFYFPKIDEIKSQLKEGWYVFVSSASISLYTTSNIFILGLFASNEIVGYFAAADKIRMAIQGLFNNAAQTIFPHLSKMFRESKSIAVEFVKKYLKASLSLGIIITLLTFIFSENIIEIVLGSNYLPSLSVFRIILFLPLIIHMSNIYGIQVMLNLGYKKEFFKIIFYAGILNLLLSFILVPIFFQIGTSISVLITETVVTVGMMRFVKMRNLLSY